MIYFKDRLRSLLDFDDSPHRLASAFALGVFIAFSPTIGLHTISCLLLAWIFRLNKLVVITGAFVNNPWTIFPMFGFCLWLGSKIVGFDKAVPAIAWDEMSLGNMYAVLKPYLLPFIAGTLVTGLFAAAVAYALIYWAAVRRRESQTMPSSSVER